MAKQYLLLEPEDRHFYHVDDQGGDKLTIKNPELFRSLIDFATDHENDDSPLLQKNHIVSGFIVEYLGTNLEDNIIFAMAYGETWKEVQINMTVPTYTPPHMIGLEHCDFRKRPAPQSLTSFPAP